MNRISWAYMFILPNTSSECNIFLVRFIDWRLFDLWFVHFNISLSEKSYLYCIVITIYYFIEWRNIFVYKSFLLVTNTKRASVNLIYSVRAPLMKKETSGCYWLNLTWNHKGLEGIYNTNRPLNGGLIQNCLQYRPPTWSQEAIL